MTTHDSPTFTDEELIAYVDERLAVTRAVELERALKSSTPLMDRLVTLIGSRDQGEESLGAMWRRGSWSCPSRAIWGAYTAGRLGDGMSQYLKFHLDEIGCRTCAANLADVERSPDADQRVRKIFQSSAGHLKSLRSPD